MRTSLRQLLAIAAAFVAVFAAPLAAQQPAGIAPADAPRLIVFLTVDQMRADYFERYGPQLTGGLARLWRGGAVFTNGFQDHAITETAPGHASTLSGRFPRSTGIVMNSAGVQDPQTPLLEAAGPGASPFRFRGGTLTDWLRIKDSRTHALSVSRKDRGAILPVGRAHQDVYWYASNGKFTTSTYYHDTLPAWVTRFNARRGPAMLAGTSWTLLLPAASYPEPDSVSIESGGRDFIFPHRIAADSAQAARTLTEYPMMDSLTIAMALEGLQATRLGLGPQTDVLAISLSTTDAVGHRYGPDSRELHDQILHLDRYLGVFFDSLYKLRDSSRIAVALTADHGVAPYPEVKSRDPNGGALHVDLQPLVRTTTDALRARGVDSSAFSFGDGAVYVDRDAFIAAHVDADSAIRAFAAAARKVPGVLRADRVSALAADSARDPIARRWLHMFPPDASAALVITLRPYSYWGSVGYAEHGTPHDYDAHVPIIFYGPAFATGHYTTFARTVDMAPTLAAIANTMPAERLDGRVLREALKSGARAATRARR